MTPTQKFLITAGVAAIIIGLLWPVIIKLGIGRLPGDIHIQRESFSFFMPITTMILASIIPTLIFRFLGK